ncbi:MAG TPA: anthranilate synthase component I family protein [Gryllotalpicola sp.]
MLRIVREDLGIHVDPELVYRAMLGEERHSFWLTLSGAHVLGRADDPDATITAHPFEQLAARLPATEVRGDGRPAPGWFGWLDYESGAEQVGAYPAGSGGAGAALMRCSRLILVDVVSSRVELAWVEGDVGAGEWARDVSAALARLARLGASPRPPSSPGADARPAAVVEWRHSGARYLELIRSCLDAIRRGDAYQLCLTNTATIRAAIDPVEMFRLLRRANPAPESALIRFGDTTLVSSSPERFLTVDVDGVVTTRPIKGTRPRASAQAEDRALAAELAADEKERAENLMIVDLMRNDLARVCRLGSVAVTELFRVESHPHVHQLVSTVRGVLAPGRTALDALRVCFPAGSMTGAPKIAAMRILHGLEGGPRGVYSGCYGAFGFDGTAQLAMTIRAGVVGPHETTIGAGGGITSASRPERELAEVATKAAALIDAALGARR